MTSKRGQDFWLVVNGLQKVANLAVKQEWEAVNKTIQTSSLKKLPQNFGRVEPMSLKDSQLMVKRSALVLENSLMMSQALAVSSVQYNLKDFGSVQTPQARMRKILRRPTAADVTEDHVDIDDDHDIPIYEPNASVTALELIEKLPDLTDRKKILSTMFIKKRKPKANVKQVEGHHSDDELLHDQKQNAESREIVAQAERDSVAERAKILKESAKAQAVPATRLGRMATFGGLGLSLGVGALAEASRRAMGKKPKTGDSKLDGSVVLTDANAERIVATLCRVRGAALKIGQMLSIQDQSLINPQVSKIFERVRQAADYMPTWQMHRVMIDEFGTSWRDNFKEFDEQPFAAASIGQVHRGVLLDGRVVAVKIQYPGVAKGIESDINNLMGILKVANIIPEKLFIDEVISHMKIELAQECDYAREAECARLMRKYLRPYSKSYYVPKVIDNLSGDQVFTSEFITGLTIDECADLDQETRNDIVKKFLVLLFTELFQFRYMQTDPNWANFLYNTETRQLGLLDFGATREYSSKFVNEYFKVLNAAATNDPDTVLESSIKLGFLTGYESKVMKDAHVESVMVLAMPFREDREFDYGNQKTTSRMHELIRVMLEHRLCPPPQEVYSLHRKMSGLFLMATKLRAKINCYPVWQKLSADFRPS